jgi:hypothetical protein
VIVADQPIASRKLQTMKAGGVVAQRNGANGDPVAIYLRNLGVCNVSQPPRGNGQAIDGSTVEWRSWPEHMISIVPSPSRVANLSLITASAYGRDQSTSPAAPSCSFIAASPYIVRHSDVHSPPRSSAISRKWST